MKLRAVNGRLFFSTVTEATGRELFIYDPAENAVRTIPPAP
jgi:hypothetical protein